MPYYDLAPFPSLPPFLPSAKGARSQIIRRRESLVLYIYIILTTLRIAVHGSKSRWLFGTAKKVKFFKRRPIFWASFSRLCHFLCAKMDLIKLTKIFKTWTAECLATATLILFPSWQQHPTSIDGVVNLLRYSWLHLVSHTAGGWQNYNFPKVKWFML